MSLTDVASYPRSRKICAAVRQISARRPSLGAAFATAFATFGIPISTAPIIAAPQPASSSFLTDRSVGFEASSGDLTPEFHMMSLVDGSLRNMNPDTEIWKAKQPDRKFRSLFGLISL